jgi:hypothetical protein
MDKVYIKGLTQNILNKQFSNQQRRKIIEYQDRINLCCPYCGDGKSDYKKRGNLYYNKLFYICFNCDKKTSFDRFAKDFNETIDPQKKLEIIEYLDSVMDYSDYDTDLNDFKLDDLFDIKDLEELFNVKDTTPIFDFKPIEEKSGIFKYLIGRGIPKHLHKDIYQAKFSKGDEGFEHVIIFLNRRGNKILGLQVRNLKEGRKRFFVIYNWESIYKWFNGDDVEIDLQKTVIYNKLSYFFNILNVKFENTITIFEGFLDSLFYPNSIGIVGVNTDLKFLENNNLDLQYFFDNDVAGFSKSEEKIHNGGHVFLWNKLFEDIVDKKRPDDPYKLHHRISKVKDLNKLNELLPDAYVKLKLYNFFSEDVFDLKYLPKKPKKKYQTIQKDYQKEFKNFDF